MTGGAISKLVAQLEADVGARLLYRTTRSIRTNEAGAEFYAAAVHVLDELDLAGERARSRSTHATGTLSVSVPTSFALRWLSPRVPEFLRRYPRLTLDLALSDRFVNLVEDGFDCALRIATQLPDSSVVVRRLGTVQRVLVAAPKYLAESKPLAVPEDLGQHNCLVYSQHVSGAEWPLGAATGRPPVVVAGSYRVNNSVMLREALVTGCGIALTPLFVVDDLLKSGALVEVLGDYRAAPHAVYGAIAQQRFVPHKVRVFLDYVEASLVEDGSI
jgi:DNA-binding transcriptional LysR family regulator